MGCTYYVRTSLCSTVEGGPFCDEVERYLDLDPVVRATFPAIEDHLETGYDAAAKRTGVEVVVSRITGTHP